MAKHIFDQLPQLGAWRLSGAYEGTEVVRFMSNRNGVLLEGTSVGVEEGAPWSIHYAIQVDKHWRFQHATVTDYAGHQLEIQTDAAHRWIINGQNHAELDDCLDLDFEASAVTNTIPVHRLALSVGEKGESKAVYIRSNGLVVERLDQTYVRLPDVKNELLFDYRSPRFGYHDTLHFSKDGLARVYPTIGVRIH